MTCLCSLLVRFYAHVRFAFHAESIREVAPRLVVKEFKPLLAGLLQRCSKHGRLRNSRFPLAVAFRDLLLFIAMCPCLDGPPAVVGGVRGE